MTDPYSHFKREYEHDGFERHSARRERNSRAPRVFAAGDLKLLSLALIAEQPCHGYDLIRRIETCSTAPTAPAPA